MITKTLSELQEIFEEQQLVLNRKKLKTFAEKSETPLRDINTLNPFELYILKELAISKEFIRKLKRRLRYPIDNNDY